ncbi:MAG: hypothetical protein OXQ86_03920 [Gammaproteobacteria bacterium]|nr:hypothetical protein [Gammaproteobacteria bacterium]
MSQSEPNSVAREVSKPVYEDMARYFAAVSEQLNGEARQAALLENSSVVGGDREEVYRRFLERHLPRACEVFRGGYVFNLEGHRSRQTDIIVTAGITPRFEMGSGRLAIAPIEGTACVVEVKSCLTTTELENSLDALQELPLIGDSVAVNPRIRVPPEQRWDRPYKVIFAYDGAAEQTVLARVNQYYRSNSAVPQERRPSLLHVLGKYTLVRATPGMTVFESDGTKSVDQPEVGEYCSFSGENQLSVMANMLARIQQNLVLANHTLVDYGKYASEVADVILMRPRGN